MKGWRLLPLGVALLLVGAGCATDGRPKPPGREGRPPAAGQGGGGDAAVAFRVETVATGLETPWSLALLPDGAILLTERPGRLRVVRGGRLLPEPAAQMPVAAVGEGGLLGLALHPRFPDRPFAYLYYTHRAGGRLSNRVARFRVAEGGPAGFRLGEEKVLLDGIPGGTIHDGGRLRFGPDGMLYVTTGDGGRPALAADPKSLAGKILRLRDDGGVPEDNPFPGSPVWSYGHRNPQGLAWDDLGRLYASEHGPTGEFGHCCHDEVNLIEPGRFYGWPLRAGREPAGAAARLGLREPSPPPVDPLAESGSDTWAPSGMAFTPEGGAGESGSLWLATLRGGHLRRLTLGAGDPPGVVRQGVALDGYGRLRDVAPGPDGCLYVLTSNRDGRGRPAAEDDRLLRLCPR